MLKNKFTALVFILLSFSLLIFVIPDNKIHSSSKYDSVNEHLDIHLKWPKFKMTHEVSDDSGNIILSEDSNGFFYLNPFTGSYNLIPVTHNYNAADHFRTASLGEGGAMCIYNSNAHIIVFLDKNRGHINVNDRLVELSSLFLGVEGMYHTRTEHKKEL